MMHAVIAWLTSPTLGFVLKVFGGVTAAAFGVLGVGAETRDVLGRLNRKGWIALTGILVGGILAMGTSVYEAIPRRLATRLPQERFADVRL